MTTALVGAFATIAALLGAAVWVVSIVRADGRERAAALVLAEKLQGRLNLTHAEAAAEITRLADDVRRATRRADALEEWARGRIAGAIDDGTDLLLAELGIVASGADDDERADTAPAGGDPRAAAPVPDTQAVARASAAGGGDVALDETLPGG
jgi:hypothetical protein